MIYFICSFFFDDVSQRRLADTELSQSHHTFPLLQVGEVDPEQHPQLGLPSIVPGYIVRPGQIRTLLQRFVKYAAKARLVHLSASSIIIIVVGAPISPAESLVSHDTNTYGICRQYARNILDPFILQVLDDLFRKLPPTTLAHPLPTTSKPLFFFSQTPSTQSSSSCPCSPLYSLAVSSFPFLPPLPLRLNRKPINPDVQLTIPTTLVA